MSTPNDTPDEALATNVREAVSALNTTVAKAYKAGLRVDLDVDWRREIGQRHDCPLVIPTVERVEKL